VWRALPQMLGELRFGPWLYRIATNAARSHLRRAHLLPWLPFGLENAIAQRAPSAEPEPGMRLAEAERIKLALAALAPQCRICLLMQVESGFSQREIAAFCILPGVGTELTDGPTGKQLLYLATSTGLSASGSSGGKIVVGEITWR
jgi:RNA polymerase sigma-70 factor (ECF subfamily)